MNDDIVTLISRNGEEKIVCPKYFGEYFQKREGYIPLKNSYISLLHKLLNINIIRKIKIICKLILKSKFIFKDPQHSETVIFDCETTVADMEKILPNKNYVVIPTRLNKIDEIYLSKKVIFYVLKNFFKRGLKQNYLLALIKVTAPKIVLTEIEFSTDFHIISKILHDENEIECIAIQNGTPHLFAFMSAYMKKNFFISKLFCFSKYDQLFYEENKINVKKIEIIGSLKSSLSYEYVKSKKMKINPNKYDICLVSTPMVFLNYDYPQVKNLADCVGLIAEFTYRLCKKHNLNLIFTGKSDKGTKYADREIFFYKHYLKDYDFKIFQSSDRRANYFSYINIMQSKLSISAVSTILREAIAFEKKILSCNFTGHPEVAFPGLGHELSEDNICIAQKPSYEHFEEKVLKILSMTNQEYFDELGKDKFLLMKPTVEAAGSMREILQRKVC